MTMLEVFVAREIYQEKLRQAEQAYRFRAIGRVSMGQRIAVVRNQIGNMLIGSGTRLQGQGHWQRYLRRCLSAGFDAGKQDTGRKFLQGAPPWRGPLL